MSDVKIKNAIAIASVLAFAKGEIFFFSHISQALAANGNLILASSDILDNVSLYD